MSDVLVVGLDDPGTPGAAARLNAVARALGPERVVLAAPDAVAIPLGARSFEPRLPAIAAAVRDATGLVVAGGTLTARARTGRPAIGVGSLLAVLRLASTLRVPSALLGVGASGIGGPRSRRLLRQAVRRTDLVILRDESSVTALAAAGLPTPMRVGADPAWSFASTTDSDTGRDGIAVAVPHDLDGDARTHLARALRPVAAAGCPVRLHPWGTAAGRRSVQAMADDVQGRVEVTAPIVSLAAAVDAMSSAHLVVASSIGAVVAASQAGAAVLAVAHHPGVASLARRLGHRSIPARASAAVLARAVMLGLEQEPVGGERIAAERWRADDGLDLAKLVVHGSGPVQGRDFSRLVLTDGSDR